MAPVDTDIVLRKEAIVNREFSLTSRLLRSVFLACAVMISANVIVFIDLLAHERAVPVATSVVAQR
jgi:hypothetical protein